MGRVLFLVPKKKSIPTLFPRVMVFSFDALFYTISTVLFFFDVIVYSHWIILHTTSLLSCQVYCDIPIFDFFYVYCIMSSMEDIRKIESTEDMMRLAGTLEASYQHAIASYKRSNDPKYLMAADMLYDIRREVSGKLMGETKCDSAAYCLITKHIPYAIVLASELKSFDIVSKLYSLISELSDNKISPCESCEKEISNKNTRRTTNGR